MGRRNWLTDADFGEDGLFRNIVDSLAEGVYFVDPQRKITYWNRGAEAITGYSAAEVLGRSCRDNILVHTSDSGHCLCTGKCPLQATLDDATTREVQVFLKHRDGHRVPVHVRVSPIVDEEGAVVGGSEVFIDASGKLALLEKAAEMERLALIDPLTAVGNRRYAESVLKERIELFRRTSETFAVLMIDLDRFKAVNDQHGHAAGDAVLQAVARTIPANLRPFDFFGRWGGEEFLAILTKADGQRGLEVANRCCGLVRSCQVPCAGGSIVPTISIGVAVIEAGDSIREVLARADANLYRAKENGRDRTCGP